MNVQLWNDWGRHWPPGVRWLFVQAYMGRRWGFVGFGLLGFAVTAEWGVPEFHTEHGRPYEA